ncbi:hypothetical protein A3K93_13425 (plasmid) [Acinetobacter sp. NCu2D-2]|uniref:amidohydrolase family protein n=1 Tax=Acinetobacter sp. NCu2D-2 TaxID=1608473 RepID=UPI0007CDF777|nr:amidohydrolase family protein [Acinetobacter sp. NCu2D-2]ANF83241.1 hypothetical protein A3K93_13425 [Acinetobacter sp. NCu2D-2]
MTSLAKVDLHSHWFSPKITQYLLSKKTGIRFIEQNGKILLDRQKIDALPQLFELGVQWFDIDLRLDHLEHHQVVHQLLSWPTTLEIDSNIDVSESRYISRLYNNDLGELLSLYPAKFSALSYLSTSDIEFATDELKRGHEELGFIGGVLPVGALSSYASAQHFADLFKAANELGSHIYLHTGSAHDTVQQQVKSSELLATPVQLQILNTSYVFSSAVFTLLFTDFLDAYPNVTVQIAMLGGSGISALLIEQILQKQQRYPLPQQYQQRLSQITFDTGAAGDGIHAIEAMRHIFGIERLVFGTDYAPQASVNTVIQHIEQTDLTENEKQQLYFDTPAHLLKQKGIHVPTLQLENA